MHSSSWSKGVGLYNSASRDVRSYEAGEAEPVILKSKKKIYIYKINIHISQLICGIGVISA